MTQESHIALLIDADNCPASKIEVILDELAKYGVTNIRRAYGNWKSPGLKSWEQVLHEFAIQPIQQFAYTKGKNATDAAMIIDAMDLLYGQELDGFCIASSDSDFTPLVMRIRANGLKVLGFGEKKTPMPFVNACSKFLYLENLDIAGPSEEKSEEPPERKNAKELRGDAKLVTLLRSGIEAAADDDGWAALGGVGSHIGNQTSFDPRNYGYRKLSDLVSEIGLFEIRKVSNHIYLRDRKAGKK